MTTANRVPPVPSLAGSASPSGSVVTHCPHEVQFYFDDRFLIRSLSDLVRTALQAGGSAVIVATEAHRESLVKELERLGLNLAAAIEQGRYVTLDASESLAAFTANGVLDETLFRSVIGNVVSCASVAALNGSKVLIFGEMVALLWQRGEAKAALELEQFWNRLSWTHAFSLRCAYPIGSFDRQSHTELFSRICGEHDVVIPAEGYTQLADEKDRLRTVARLQQTEQALKTETEHRRLAQGQALEVRSRNEILMEEIRKREAAEDELRRFTRRLLTVRDEEQRHIAAELHENTAQLLAALSLYFGVLQEEKASLNPRLASVVSSSRAVSDSLLSQIRKLSRWLHPPTLDDMGVGSALKEYVEQRKLSTGARIDLEISDDLGRFDRNLEITVFRIVEEALANFEPRSGSSISVRLSRSATKLMAVIRSQASATLAADANKRNETGITGIHERVMEHGGTVQFTSDRSGMLLCVTLPLEAGDRRNDAEEN